MEKRCTTVVVAVELMVKRFQAVCSSRAYCKSINICAPLIVQILQVVENPKLLWLQTFFGTLWRLVPTTRRHGVCTTAYIISGSVHCPVSPGSLRYWKVHSRTQHTNASNEYAYKLSKILVRKLKQLLKEIDSTTETPRGNRGCLLQLSNCIFIQVTLCNFLSVNVAFC